MDWRTTGSVTYETYYLGLLADVLAEQGDRDGAAHALDGGAQAGCSNRRGLVLIRIA